MNRLTSLTPLQKTRLHTALEKTKLSYDAQIKLLRLQYQSSGYEGAPYHTNIRGGWIHPIRESFNYALALLDAEEESGRLIAIEILDRLLSLQDADPESKSYGIWSWFWEEPLSAMSPPDWNWADFCGVRLIEIILCHGERLPLQLQKRIGDALARASKSIQRRDVEPAYTNIAIMGSFVSLATAENYGLPELEGYAVSKFDAFYKYTKLHGSFTEYNSPAYTVTALDELCRILTYIQNSAVRNQAEYLYRLGWEEMASHFHAPTRQWSGPHSRCYSTLMKPAQLSMISRATSGRFPDVYTEPTIVEHRPKHACPVDLQERILHVGESREIRKVFLKSSPSLIGTTWLTPQISLGSINYGDCWNQRRSLIAYVGNSPDSIHYIHMRVLRDGYDLAAAQFCSAQNQGCVLGAVNFARDGGNTHLCLDPLKNEEMITEDLRLRFEVGGSKIENPLPCWDEKNASIQLRLGEVGLAIAVPYVEWAGIVPRFEVTPQNSKIGIDIVLYKGVQRRFSLHDIKKAVIGFAFCLSEGSVNVPEVTASESLGRVVLKWQRMRLNVPIAPQSINQLADDRTQFPSGKEDFVSTLG